MASGGHTIRFERAQLESKLSTLTNDDLKKICRAYDYQTSGVKAVLVQRVRDALINITEQGDVGKFEDFRYRVEHRGANPPAHFVNASNVPLHPPSTSNHYPNHTMAPQRVTKPPSVQNRNGPYFKSSPFYEILEPLVPLTVLPGSEMTQHRHTVKTQFSIRPEMAQQIRNDSSLKIVIYCGLAQDMEPYSLAHVAFPGQVEVRVNETEVRANFKGLKNKPGSTKPADLTTFVRKFKGEMNFVHVTYALTTKRYAYIVYLVRYNNAEKLVERIKRQSIIRKHTVLNRMSEANADDDIAATSFRMSLKDPISTIRISVPVRSSVCSHYQCYDCAMYMQLQEQAPQWTCPICSRAVSFESLCVDEYFQEILAATPKSTEKVDIEPDGTWKIIKEEEDEDQAGTRSNKPRASYDDDFDDDLVEVDQLGGKSVNSLKKESQSQSGRPAPLDTPPLSSREPSVAQSASTSATRPNKRPHSAVVDLTLSDDEDDQPPRPAKRMHPSRAVNGSVNSASSAYNTPKSNPESVRLRLPQRKPGNTSTSSGSNPQQPESYRSASATSFNARPSPAYNSMSPPTTNSPAVFGQSGFSAQNSRQPSHLPLPQPYATNSNSGGFSGYGNGFPPNSPFAARPPSQQSYTGNDSPNPASNMSDGGLRLPPMQQHQQQYQQLQQHNPWSSPPPAYQGAWRSDGNEYHYNSGTPPG